MNSINTCLLLLFLNASVFGQGHLDFENRVRRDAPVTFVDGTGPGASMIAGLYLVRNGTLELIATSVFREQGQPSVKSYIQPIRVTVPGVPPGASATFRVRVWPAGYDSYEAAVVAGACSGEFPTLAGNGEAFVPALGEFSTVLVGPR